MCESELSRRVYILYCATQVPRVISRLKTGSLYILLNSVLPGYNVYTDFFTFYQLWEHNHTKWAWAVLFFLFFPFLFNIGEFVVNLCKEKKVRESSVVRLFLHFPFVAPIVHLSLGLRILLIDPTQPENLSSIEKVAKVAALDSMYEDFLESGPQLQVQLHIILSTGTITINSLTHDRDLLDR